MYNVTCALEQEGYLFTLYKGKEPMVPIIEYSPGEVVVITPRALTGSRVDWDSSPGWWSIQGCYFGLAASGPFGAAGEQYVEPVAVVLSNGSLQITDVGTVAATYNFFLQIRFSTPSLSPQGYPLQAVIIWDPELQNTGTG